MSLSLANDSTIFRAISYDCKYKNIFYDPKNSLLDYIIYSTNDNYFIISDQTYNISDNVIHIPQSHLEFHSYHLILSNNIENYLDNQLSHSLHLPIIFLIDSIKDYKKEDRHLIQQRLSNHTKIFLNKSTYDLFQSKNSIYLEPGIPTNIFSNSKNYEDRIAVGLLDCGPLTKNIQQTLKQLEIESEIIDMHQATNDLVNSLNNYKVCLDISQNYKINLLCAIACGAQGLTLNNGAPNNESLIHLCDQQELLKTIQTLINTKPDYEANINYLDSRYSMPSFISTFQNIIDKVSHEVYTI